MNITTYSLGADEEVAGSKHFLAINKKLYEIDCGGWQGDKKTTQKNKDFVFPDKINTVFITHAHYDHIGLLPKLVKQGFSGKIYSTPATRDLASVILQDSAKIQKNENNVIYEEKDCLETMKFFRCISYDKEKKISDELKVKFFDAGHILGSAMIDFQIPKYNRFINFFMKKNIHVLFTGDLGRKSNPICNEPETKIPPPDYIFLESTYGNRTHESLDTVYQELTYIINRTIEREGKIIIPAFAVERSQELIFFIKTLMNEKKIPRIPVYIDSPMASNATGVFSIHSECFNNKIIDEFISKGKNPFSVRTLKFINDYKESIRIAKSTKPCIVISCSGMCENGRILNHLKYGIENPNNTILLVGYMAPNTLGRKILNKSETITIDKKEFKLKAEIHKIDAFSAHSDYKETLEWLNGIDKTNLKKIFLVHGEKEPQEFLSQKIKNKFGTKIEIVKEGKRYKLN